MAESSPLDTPPSSVRAAWDLARFARESACVTEELVTWLAASQARTDLPVMPAAPPRARWEAALAAGVLEVPEQGTGDVGAEVRRALDASIRLQHPHALGHQVPPPLPTAVALAMVSAATNNGMAVYEMGAAGVMAERAVTTWMARQLGLPAQAGGVLTSGGSLANLTALLAARGRALATGVASDRLVLLVASSAHYSLARAARIMGLADAQVQTVGCDPVGRMDPADLRAQLAGVLARGQVPFAVVASAASTSLGAIDPLDAIADACAEARVWLHVDGAHGASLALSRTHAQALHGIGRADSVVWDAHKLLFMPALISAVLYRSHRDGYAAFATEAEYLFARDRDDDEWWNPGLRTLECTKRIMAVQLLATLRTVGLASIRDALDHVLALARGFADDIAADPALELALPPACNIVCFRPRGADSASVVALRQRILDEGAFYLVQTRIGEAVWLRCAIMNPLATRADLRALLARVRAG